MLLIVALLFCVSCQKRTPTLNLLVWEGYADPSFIKGFEAQCKCKVSASYMGSSDELVAKLRGGSSGTYDVISPSSDVATMITQSGLAAPLDLAKLPSYTQLSAQLTSLPLVKSKGNVYGVPFMVANLDYSDYLGRLAIARVFNGTMFTGEDVAIAKRDGSLQKTKITKLFSFSGLKRTDITETSLGDIIAVAGVEGITIGETITDVLNPTPLPPIVIDEPTIAMQFSVNTSPFSGRDGTYVTSRNLRDRLEKELLTNVSLRMEETGTTDSFTVMGRGELQLSILIEMMRREGYELMVSKPEIVTKRVDGKLMEPVEHLTIDIPEEFVGVVMEQLGTRKAEVANMHNHGYGRVRIEFRVASRGLIGLRSQLLTDTRGTIVMNSLFDGYTEWQGEIPHRLTGALISDRGGVTTAYSLWNLQERGELFVGPGVDVYEGMVIGENAKDNDLDVNVVREKKLTNMELATYAIIGVTVVHLFYVSFLVFGKR